MSDVLTKIDWNQVGPFTALLLVAAIILLGLAPFAFRYFGKRGDMDEEDRKRDFERESKKDAALIEFIRTSSESITRIAVSSERLASMIDAFEHRSNAKLESVEKNLVGRIEQVEKLLNDKRQEEILSAISQAKTPATQ